MIEKMKQWLEALELVWAEEEISNKSHEIVVEAATTMKQAIAEAEKQEPVAWIVRWNDDGIERTTVRLTKPDGEWSSERLLPLYTIPPASQKPLTDEMVVAAARVMCERQADSCVDRDDQWEIYSDEFKADALAMLKAAHNIKENNHD